MLYSGPFFYHQMGHQDKNRCLKMLQARQGEGIILSPHDLVDKKIQSGLLDSPILIKCAADYKDTDAELMIDPQSYIYPQSTLENSAIPLAQDSQGMLDPKLIADVINALDKQRKMNATRYIIPSPPGQFVDSSWLSFIGGYATAAQRWADNNGDNTPLYSTILVAASEISTTETRNRLLNKIFALEVTGFYLLISEVEPYTEDKDFLFGFLDFVFSARWNQKEVLLGYCGPWSLLGFPFGLNGFANSGAKNRQSLKIKEEQGFKRSGGGNKHFYDLWSPELLTYLRYPHDVSLLTRQQSRLLFPPNSPYSPNLDKNPDEVYQTGEWKKHDSYNDFSWKMYNLAHRYQHLSRQKRIAQVHSQLSRAADHQKTLTETVKEMRPFASIWLEAFNAYLYSGTREEDLEDIFG
ncbi:MAG: hypothetical protein K8I82_30535 [Anaerolineae bacterium]|nr:hypothetical protein [Anaerolineae bacterium]